MIEKYAKYSDHQHGHIILLQGNILKDPLVKNISSKFIYNYAY